MVLCALFETGRIGEQIIEYPFLVGHECSATVAAVGSGAMCVKPGDRVAVDLGIPCFKCDQCKAGREHTCRQLLFLGCPGQVDGCLCEYSIMPETSCFLLQHSVSFSQGVLSEPLAIAMYAVHKAQIKPGMRVGESSSVSMPGRMVRRGRDPWINCTVEFGVITLHAIGADATPVKAQALVEQDVADLCRILGDLVFGQEYGSFAHVIGRSLLANQATLVVAESCTGGLVARVITRAAGASAFFLSKNG